MSKIAVGMVRPSQLLWTYGPGALVDLPNLSVITMGLDLWERDRCVPLEEARLLEAVRRIVGPQVERLRTPPVVTEENIDPFSAEAKVGVPVRPFPRWLRCVRCGLLSPYDSRLFSIKPDHPYRPSDIHFEHTGCEKSAHSDGVPARFLLACRNGHLDDFPWHWFVHGGKTDCKGTLRFFETGASLQTENLWVKCDECKAARSLAHAFGSEAKENLPACRGRHPHLDDFDEDCREPARTVLLGATNSWFPITISVLAIPHTGDSLSQLVSDGWEDFRELESEEELRGVLKTFVRRGVLTGISAFSPSEVWSAIQRKRSGAGSDEKKADDIKGPEWSLLTNANPPADWPHFLSEEVERPEGFPSISRVLLLKRLREVNALIGYTRVEAPEETTDPEEKPTMAALWKSGRDWMPAVEVHGEGIFLSFDAKALSAWEKRPAVLERDRRLRVGHKGWRNARKLDPEQGYPAIRFVMLHTLAHLLIRELALECGYNAASIRERIYADAQDDQMAGVLLYTAAADSDGTLGGLIELGKPENLAKLLSQCLHRASICSSDPLCSEHDPEEDRSLHGASCHSCAFVAETSCERSNRYLDRGLLVSTFERTDAAFFELSR